MKRSKYKYRGNRQRTDKNGLEVSCTGKIRWWSKERAQAQAKEINENRLVGERKVRAYKCRNCGNFHVGREPKK